MPNNTNPAVSPHYASPSTPTPVQAVATLIPGILYEYVYKTGESIQFTCESVRRANIVDPTPNVFGRVFFSTRTGITASPSTTIRIAKLSSIEPSRLRVIANPGRYRTSDEIASAMHVSPAAIHVQCTTHQPINVGFLHLKLVCKICDADIPTGGK